jgi:hypothetical protein
MSMKKTDLEKSRMMKMSNLMKVAGIPDRFGKGAVVPDRKEQRRLDHAAGLVPFACKLHTGLVAQLHAEVAKQGTTMNELVAELLENGLGSEKAVARDKPVAIEKPVAIPKPVADAKPLAKEKAVAKEKPVTQDKAAAKEKTVAKEKAAPKEKAVTQAKSVTKKKA